MNTAVANNNGDFDSDGYTDLEEYLNDIAAWPAPGIIRFTGQSNLRYEQIQNWRVDGVQENVQGQGVITTSSLWQPSRYDVVHILDATVSVDSVGQQAGRIVLAPAAGDQASLTVGAGWLQVTDEIVIGQSSGMAELTLAGGDLYAARLSRGSGGSFEFTGGRLHVDEVAFDLVNQGGTLEPGAQFDHSTGVTTVLGNFAQMASGTIHMRVNGPTPGAEHDQLVVMGAATLAGTLDIEISAELAEPADRGSFVAEVLLSGATLFGAFDAISIDSVDATSGPLYVGSGNGELDGIFRIVSTTTTEVVLTHYLALPGDANGDMVVDVSDFNIWNSNKFSADTDWLHGDFNGDGNTDVSDFNIWNANKFSSVPMTPAVPEPAGGLLAIGLFLGLWAASRPSVSSR